MKTSLEHTITKGLWRAKFEKNKSVNVLKVAKEKLWFEFENKIYVYNLERFINDFMKMQENVDEA